MIYKLGSNYILRGWNELPYALCEVTTGKIIPLGETAFVALSHCDGSTDINSPWVLSPHRKLIEQFKKQGIICQCKESTKLDSYQKYKTYPCKCIPMVRWSITGRCNYKCRHCYLSAPEAKFGELSHEICLDIINQVSECGIMNVSLTGGEPLVRDDFFELVDAICNKNIHIAQICSNGALINERFLDELEKRSLKPQFSISFDGIGWHDWLRGVRGAERTTLNAIKLLHCRGFSIIAMVALHKRNVNILEDTIKLLISLGVDEIIIAPVAASGNWLREGGLYDLSLDEWFEACLTYIPKYFEAGSPVNLHLTTFFECNKGSKCYSIPAEKFNGTQETCNHTVCDYARSHMYICPDGKILPCMTLSGIEGNTGNTYITKTPLKEALNSSDYMKLVDMRLDKFFETCKECGSCEYRMRCAGGCRCSAFSASGEFIGPDYNACTIFKGGYIEKIHDVCRPYMYPYTV